MRGATIANLRLNSEILYFNSHAPCGARQIGKLLVRANKDFNSHAPCGARLDVTSFDDTKYKFQLTRPMRGATKYLSAYSEGAPISTHTPHAGRDCYQAEHRQFSADFNSHAPCGARQET